MSDTQESIRAPAYRGGEISCEDCGHEAALFAAGWRASLLGEPYTDELPELTFRCPDCATAELAAT